MGHEDVAPATRRFSAALFCSVTWDRPPRCSGQRNVRRVEPRLCIDQEGAGGGDPVTGGEAVEDGKRVARAWTQDHGSTLEYAGTGLDVDDCLGAGVYDGRFGHGPGVGNPVPPPRIC
jgi:hypothetical protein